MSVNISEPFLTRAREQAARAGYADVGAYLEVLIEEADFDFPVESREDVLASLREGLADVAAGRSRPVDEVMTEIAKKYNLPPVNETER